MKIIGIILFIFASQYAIAADHGRGLGWGGYLHSTYYFFAGAKYTWGTHSGYMSIDGASSFAAPVTHGDTVVITGHFSSNLDANHFSTGILGDSIVIDMTSADWTGTSYTQTFWQNFNYVKVIGGRTLNYYYGNCTWYQAVYNTRWTGFNMTNQVGHYQDGQIAIQIGANHNAAMLYVDGSNDLTKVYHGLKLDHDTLNGFQNSGSIANINDGLYNIMIDFEFSNNVIKNMTSRSPGGGVVGGSPGVFAGTVLNYNFHNNFLDSLNADIGACQCTHNEWVDIIGYGKFEYNRSGHDYGSMLRAFPAVYGGITGYGYDFTHAVLIDNNADQRKLGYCMFESNESVPSNLLSAGFAHTRTFTYYNSLDSTNVDVYNPSHPTTPPFNPYEAAVMSIYADSNMVTKNYQTNQAVDTTPPGLLASMSSTNLNGHTTGRDTVGNQNYLFKVNAGVDSLNWPAIFATSPLRTSRGSKASLIPLYNNISLNGQTRAAEPNDGVGAYYYVASSPPTVSPRKNVIFKRSVKNH